MEPTDDIFHRGIVSELLSENEAAVILAPETGCDGCAAVRLCHAGQKEGEPRQLTASVGAGITVRPGDAVTLKGTEAIHRRAIMLATVIPCLTLIGVMALVRWLTSDSTLAALSGLGAMIFFFAGLFAFRHHLAKEFRFEIIEAIKPN